jgi:predicted small integral membrane protein
LSKTVKRLKDWFKGYEEAPVWLCFCRLIFAVSTLAFIVLFFGPAILSGDVIGFWMYQHWALTYAGFQYIVVIVISFTLAVISGVPTFLYKHRRMRQAENEAEK